MIIFGITPSEKFRKRELFNNSLHSLILTVEGGSRSWNKRLPYSPASTFFPFPISLYILRRLTCSNIEVSIVLSGNTRMHQMEFKLRYLLRYSTGSD